MNEILKMATSSQLKKGLNGRKNRQTDKTDRQTGDRDRKGIQARQREIVEIADRRDR